MTHQSFFHELKKDHEEVKNMLAQMKSQSSEDAAEMLMQLKGELIPHQEAEEKTFYKAMEEKDDSRKLALKGEEEHHVAASVLEDMEIVPKDDRWMAKLEVLEELVKEHIKEEESQVFNAAQTLDESEMENIEREFQSLKLQIKSDLQAQSAEPSMEGETSEGNMYQKAIQPDLSESASESGTMQEAVVSSESSSSDSSHSKQPSGAELGTRSGNLPNEDLGQMV